MNLQIITDSLALGSVYALLALSFNLIYKTTRILHISHGAVYVASAYIFYVCKILLSLPFVISLVISLSVSLLLGIAYEVFLYYPLYRKKASLLLSFISSLGMYLFVINLVALIFGNEVIIIQKDPDTNYVIFDIILTKMQTIEILSFICIFPIFYFFLRTTNLGKSINALSNNPELAVVLGMNIRRIRVLVFSIGSILTAVSGILVSLDIGTDPNMGFSAVFIAIVAVVISGTDVIEGAILGAFLLAFIQNFTSWSLSARWQEAITFGILILFLLLRPQGLLSQKKRVEEVL